MLFPGPPNEAKSRLGPHLRVQNQIAQAPLPGIAARSRGATSCLVPDALRYLSKEYGVTLTQSLASGGPIFNVQGGTNSVGFGFSATRMLTVNWLINLDAAVSQLRGSAANSPITEARTQPAVAVSVDYHW